MEKEEDFFPEEELGDEEVGFAPETKEEPSQEKKYTCEQCGETFDEARLLNLHKGQKHRTKKYHPPSPPSEETSTEKSPEEEKLPEEAQQIPKKIELRKLPLLEHEEGGEDEEEEPILKGPDTEALRMRKRLIEALDIFPLNKDKKKYIISLWDKDLGTRDERGLYQALVEVDRVTPMMASRIVNMVFCEEDYEYGIPPYIGYRPKRGYGYPPYISHPGYRDYYQPGSYYMDYGYDRPPRHDRGYTEAEVREKVETQVELYKKDLEIKQLKSRERPEKPQERITITEQVLDPSGRPLYDPDGSPILRRYDVPQDQAYFFLSRQQQPIQTQNTGEIVEKIFEKIVPLLAKPEEKENREISELKAHIKSLEDKLVEKEHKKEIDDIKSEMANQVGSLRNELIMEKRAKHTRDEIYDEISRRGLLSPPPGLPPEATVAIKELDSKVALAIKALDNIHSTADSLIRLSHKASTPLSETTPPPKEDIDKLKKDVGEYIE